MIDLATRYEEIQEQKPCDGTCNPATHCCQDLSGFLGGGGSGGLPGFDGGLGLPSEVCLAAE